MPQDCCVRCYLPLEGPSGDIATCPHCRDARRTPPPLPADLDDPLPVARLVPEVIPVATAAPAPAPFPLTAASGFVFRFLFFLCAPLFFGITCLMINQPFLLVLLFLTVGLTGLLSNPAGVLATLPWLGRLALVGDALRTLGRLHAYYHDHAARPFVFYLFYPVTGPVSFLISPGARQEARLYLGVMGFLTVGMTMETVLSYRAVYPPHLSFTDALTWILARLLLSVLVVLGFLVPVAATTFSYQRAGKKWQLRALAGTGLVSAVYATVGYYGMTHASISFLSSEHLARRMDAPTFRAALRETTEHFLTHHARRLPPGDAGPPAVHEELTAKYRLLIGKLAVGDEALAFSVLTLPGDGAERWLAVRLEYNESSNYPPVLIAAAGPHAEFHACWYTLPARVRSCFRTAAAASSSPDRVPIGDGRMLDDLP